MKHLLHFYPFDFISLLTKTNVSIIAFFSCKSTFLLPDIVGFLFIGTLKQSNVRIVTYFIYYIIFENVLILSFELFCRIFNLYLFFILTVMYLNREYPFIIFSKISLVIKYRIHFCQMPKFYAG